MSVKRSNKGYINVSVSVSVVQI